MIHRLCCGSLQTARGQCWILSAHIKYLTGEKTLCGRAIKTFKASIRKVKLADIRNKFCIKREPSSVKQCERLGIR